MPKAFRHASIAFPRPPPHVVLFLLHQGSQGETHRHARQVPGFRLYATANDPEDVRWERAHLVSLKGGYRPHGGNLYVGRCAEAGPLRRI